jgi:hypothetical protein
MIVFFTLDFFVFSSRQISFAKECGHNYHALCVASAFQIQQLCPLCRTAVSDGTCMEVVAEINSSSG